MKSIPKRFMIMLICLLLIIPFVLVSCDTGDTNSGNSAANTSKASTNNGHGGVDADGKYYVKMPANPNPDKTEFKVLVYNNVKQTTYFSEEVGTEIETTDDKLAKAVGLRNDIISQNYGVKVVAVYTDDVGTDVKRDALAGSSEYDAAMPFLSSCTTLAQEGYLYDLDSDEFEEYIDLEMPWWDSNATKSLSIGNKVYFTTGDISIMQKIVSVAVTFNKKMLADSAPDVDIYDLVRDGKWTLDEMIKLSKNVTKDNGDGITNSKDTWGLSSSRGDAAMYYLASGETFIKKDADDNPMMAIGEEKSINVSQKVLEQLQKKNEWNINCEDFGLTGEAMWKESLAVFGEGRALFRTSAFSAIKKLRNYEADYGVVPMPKFNETQDSYFTPCSARYAYGVVIPTCVPSSKFSAFMLEVMSCEAKNYISDAYYTTILKDRDMNDNDSEEMLDKYIFNNVVYDLGIVYDFGGVSSMFSKLMETGSTAIASKIEELKPVIESKITEIVTSYQD